MPMSPPSSAERAGSDHEIAWKLIDPGEHGRASIRGAISRALCDPTGENLCAWLDNEGIACSECERRSAEILASVETSAVLCMWGGSGPEPRRPTGFCEGDTIAATPVDRNASATERGELVDLVRRSRLAAASERAIYGVQAEGNLYDDLADALSDCIAAAPRPPVREGLDLDKLADEYVQRVTEWDDRTSPEDWPEALLITGDELKRELLQFAVDAVEADRDGRFETIARPATDPAPEDQGETFETINAWSLDTFGPVTLDIVARRAAMEMDELLAEPERVEEAADVVIVLSRYPGLWAAVERKMAVNRARKWRLMGDGTGYHVPAGAPPPDTAEAAETGRGFDPARAALRAFRIGDRVRVKANDAKPWTHDWQDAIYEIAGLVLDRDGKPNITLAHDGDIGAGGFEPDDLEWAANGNHTTEWFRASDGTLTSFPRGFDPNRGAYAPPASTEDRSAGA